MAFYFLIATLVFAVNAAMTYTTKTVTHKQGLTGLFVFPLAYFLCGLPLENFGTHILAALALWVVGFVLFVRGVIGAGVVRAFTMAALWMPSWALLFDYVTTTLMILGAISLVMLLLIKSDRLVIKPDRIEHFAALALACCAGFFAYQYHEGTPAKLALDNGKPQAAMSASLSESTPPPALRGAQTP